MSTDRSMGLAEISIDRSMGLAEMSTDRSVYNGSTAVSTVIYAHSCTRVYTHMCATMLQPNLLWMDHSLENVPISENDGPAAG